MFPNIAFVPCSTQNLTFVPCSPGINVISPVSKNPWEGLHYVDVIFSHNMLTTEIKKRPIDGRSANKRMVEQKLELSTRSDLKRELVALLSLSSWCLVMVVWLFLAVPWVCLRFVIVVFSDHTH